MPEHLRALVVILILATTVFAFAKAPACALASTSGDFERRRNLWLAITLTAFLAHNFWIYIVVVAALLLFALPREPNRLAMFFFLLFAVPAIDAEITGLGVIRYFFTLHYVRLLELTVLLPAFLLLRKQPDSERFGRSLPDKLIAGYVILICVLTLGASTVTHTLRSGVFYAFIDIFLPYYVASRSLKNLQGFRDALMAFVVAALVLSAIGVFEFARHWLLYAGLGVALDAQWASGGVYLERGDDVRAQGSAGHAIPFGYVIAVASGFFLYLKRSVPNAMAWGLGLLLLIVGLIASLSRGPWLGAAAMLSVFVATGPSPGKGFVKLGLLGVIILPLLLVTPFGEKIVDLLPFVGGIASDTITYRQQLLKICIGVILQNPFFGAYDFMYSPAMQELKQGQGIIDIVNSYIGVALGSGLVGLSLFSGFFIAVAIGIFNAMRKLPDKNNEHYVLGQVLLSTLLGIMVIIFTCSSIFTIPVIYWAVAGLGVAYARMLALAKDPVKALATAGPDRFQPATTRLRT